MKATYELTASKMTTKMRRMMSAAMLIWKAVEGTIVENGTTDVGGSCWEGNDEGFCRKIEIESRQQVREGMMLC